ncbi:baeRF3 domain-containing protein [Actinacidiphila paucisporea]|uniref:Uncharacterized protein n=1 Tax=Actinacidiphila paucisporea TaxID=310782 RepID=A0A1M7NGS7_9ACTN|nr:hypothetical protein [Actinacidiphila paucisporea]SHN02437.1 hypothetical protein SAMN05216499_118110 [Actinacidiphila paucisporea]
MADTYDLTPEVLADLRTPRPYPAITLAMPTDPDLPFGDKERILLRDLVTQAKRQLAADTDVPRDAKLELRDRLLDPDAIEEAGFPLHPAGALVVHIAAGEPIRVWQLTSPPVQPRVEFATVFLTRYAVAAEQRSHPYLVLVLDREMCRLYNGSVQELAEVTRYGFPAAPQIPSPEDSIPGPIPRAAPYESHQERVKQYLRTVDSHLGRALKEHNGAPLFVVGGEKALSIFNGVTVHRDRVAGTLPLVGMDKDPKPDLAKRLTPLLDEFRVGQIAEAVEEAEEARSQQRYAGGAPEVWTAVADKRVRRLLVEEGLLVAGRISEDARILDVVPYPEPVTLPDPWPDVEGLVHADVATDVVEQMVERAVQADSQVLFVPDGSLLAADGVAAVLRY